MISASTDPAWSVAGRLLQARGLTADDHMLMRENMATYLTQLKPDFVDSLTREPDDFLLTSVRRGFSNGDMRWTQKLVRDLEAPYTDGQVVARAKALDEKLADKMAKVLACLPADMPCKLYVTGSLVKGRFGAHSDVDAVCDAPASLLGTLGVFPGSDVSLQYAGGGGPSLAAFGEHVEVDARDLHSPVQAIFADALARKGYHLQGEGEAVAVTPPAHPVPREKETPPAAAGGVIWSFADLP